LLRASLKATSASGQQSTEYDLVIIDHRLPGGVGTELARLVRRIQPAARIALISAVDPRELAEQGFIQKVARNAHGFVTKPFQAPHFIKVLEDLFRPSTFGPPAELLLEAEAASPRRAGAQREGKALLPPSEAFTSKPTVPRSATTEAQDSRLTCTAMQRRSGAWIIGGDFFLQLERRQVYLDGNLVHLSWSSVRLLGYLLLSSHRIVNTRQIRWILRSDSDKLPSTNVVQQKIYALRLDLRNAVTEGGYQGHGSEFIVTIQGVGYRFQPSGIPFTDPAETPSPVQWGKKVRILYPPARLPKHETLDD
jgi:DNA-binding response OmpR family regulator